MVVWCRIAAPVFPFASPLLNGRAGKTEALLAAASKGKRDVAAPISLYPNLSMLHWVMPPVLES